MDDFILYWCPFYWGDTLPSEGDRTWCCSGEHVVVLVIKHNLGEQHAKLVPEPLDYLSGPTHFFWLFPPLIIFICFY